MIENCPECKGAPGRDCCECHGTGKILRRACPLCGDIAWDYVNGVNDRDGMACRISCGYRWTASDPGWRPSGSPAHRAPHRSAKGRGRWQRPAAENGRARQLTASLLGHAS